MMYLDKDMERVMQKKKRDVINELEAYKNKILQELSGVDKLTLTRLRQILADYNSIQKDIEDHTDMFEEVTVRLNQKLDECEAVVGNLNGIEKTKIVYADKFVDSTGSIDDAILYAESMAANNVLIKLGSGVYTFSKQFRPKKCIVIEGCGSSQTTLKYIGTSEPAVMLEDVDGCGFRGVGLYGDANNRVDGMVIRCNEKSQTGGHVLEDIWIRYFETGLRIEENVFTVRAKYIRIYECSQWGFHNSGTDNQFMYLCTQGNKQGNYFGGSNNAYGMVYSIFDGEESDTYSNFITGTRNHFSQFTTQDSYKPLVFNDFHGIFNGQTDAIYHSSRDGYVKPDYLVEIRNRSEVTGTLAVASYRTQMIPQHSVYVDEFSIFTGQMPHSVFLTPVVEGVINDNRVLSEIDDPFKNVVEGLGFINDGSTLETNGIYKIGYDTSYTSSVKLNGIMPDEGKTWLITGYAAKNSNVSSATLQVYNNNAENEGYVAKKVLDLTDEYQPFYVAVHRKGDLSVTLMFSGMSSGTCFFKDLKAYDITGLTSKRYFSIPSCYSVFN